MNHDYRPTPFPPGWAWQRIGDVGEVRLGRQRAPANHLGPFMRPYLRVANVFEDRIDLSDVMEMNFTPAEAQIFELRPGDILLNEGQSPEYVGRPAMYRGELPGACFTNSLIRFRCGSSLRPKFALLVFRWYMHGEVFKKVSRWTTNIAHLGGDRFAALFMPVPPLHEQDRIIAGVEEHLSSLEAGVACLERGLAKLKRYEASVLKTAIEGHLVQSEAELAREEGRPSETGADAIIAIGRRGRPRVVGPDCEPPSSLPEGWAWASVDEVGDVLLGRRRAPEYQGSGRSCRYLRVANVKDDRLELEDLEAMDWSPAHFTRYALLPGDILVSEGQSPERIGQSAIFRGEASPLCFQATLHRFRPVPCGPSSEYAQLVFRAHVKNGVFRERGSITTNIAHLTLEKFKASPFPLPPRAEQERIVAAAKERLEAAERLKREIQAQRRRAENLRRSILKSAFEARLVAQNPAEEPAPILRGTRGSAEPLPGGRVVRGRSRRLGGSR